MPLSPYYAGCFISDDLASLQLAFNTAWMTAKIMGLDISQSKGEFEVSFAVHGVYWPDTGAITGAKPPKRGHLFAFGNTEVSYRIMILGTKRRGNPRSDSRQVM